MSLINEIIVNCSWSKTAHLLCNLLRFEIYSQRATTKDGTCQLHQYILNSCYDVCGVQSIKQATGSGVRYFTSRGWQKRAWTKLFKGCDRYLKPTCFWTLSCKTLFHSILPLWQKLSQISSLDRPSCWPSNRALYMQFIVLWFCVCVNGFYCLKPVMVTLDPRNFFAWSELGMKITINCNNIFTTC